MWNAGCQIVALNYQTHCHDMMYNAGRFRDNGGAGYVLKPTFQCKADSGFNPNDPSTFGSLTSRTLTITIISGQQLPKPKGATRGEVIDPYVIVAINGVPADEATVCCRRSKEEGEWRSVVFFQIPMCTLTRAHSCFSPRRPAQGPLITMASILFGTRSWNLMWRHQVGKAQT